MKRYLPFLIIVAVALVTAAVALGLYRSKMGAQKAPVQPASASSSAVAAASAPMAPLPTALPVQPDAELAHVMGPADAPVTLEIYGDFQCPPCATATANLDDLAKAYAGKLRMIFHEFPLAMHNHALDAAMAAEAAGAQVKFWPMHDMLYRYQSIWSKASDPARLFATYAQSLGLDPAEFERDQHSDAIKGRIMTQGDAGLQRGVKNTPTIFVNGVEVRGGFSRDGLKTAIDAALLAGGKS